MQQALPPARLHAEESIRLSYLDTSSFRRAKTDVDNNVKVT
jgi:hypothetical protein